ncbi:MAG: hypothetical protein AWU58_332, partial [Methanohalophilus sp. T328-1]
SNIPSGKMIIARFALSEKNNHITGVIITKGEMDYVR